MPEAIARYLANRTSLELVRDVVDVVVVYYVFYRLLLVARGTRAMQVAAGLAIVAGLYVVAKAVGLVTITSLVGSLLQSIILVIVVVFQNDIRRALQRVGSRAFFGSFTRTQETAVIDEVVEAARELARHRMGAIIAFEQDANLDEFVGQNKGIDLDAKVTSELLVALFVPEGTNKLHDGSVVIRNLRVAKAGVFYPMPEGRVFDSSFGSRHRAALGITEETDAVVVVVSEERGTISFCFNGNIASDLGAEQLRDMLLSIMSPKVRKKAREATRRRLSSLPRGSLRDSLREAGPDSERPRAPSFSAESPTQRRTIPPPPVDTPVPLRKSALPESPDYRAMTARPAPVSEPETSSDGSLKLQVAESRPMPRGNELPPLEESDDSQVSASEHPLEESDRP